MFEEEELIMNNYGRDEVSDLIENPPSWLLRSGIAMVGLIICSILAVSSFIKYPDKIVATGILTSETPPVEIISKSDGYIENIFIEDLENVPAGKALFTIKNTANQADIFLLENWIEEYALISNVRMCLLLDIPSNLKVGMIQPEYASLVLKYHEFQQTIKDEIVSEQVQTISQEIKKIKTLNLSQEKEKSIFKEELTLQEKDYQRNESLANSGVVSQVDLERAKTSFLQKERQYEGMENAIIQNNIRIEQLRLDKLRLQGERAKLMKSYQFQIAEMISRLKATIQNWSEAYRLSSPISGEISMLSEVKENKFIKTGQVMAHVLPKGNNQAYVSVKAPTTNTGKLKIGLKVILKFDAFPHKEYGIVESEISELGRLPQVGENAEAYYEIKAMLQDSIITDFDIPIPFKPNLPVSVEIITEDQTISERIFHQLLSIIKHA